MDYIAALEGLSHCQALLANVTREAVTYALGCGADASSQTSAGSRRGSTSRSKEADNTSLQIIQKL
ncbi:MAG: hypothetical protein J6D54_03020 [Olsenella sp.]|nr:hypothetical protein [Olsenella sp.]